MPYNPLVPNKTTEQDKTPTKPLRLEAHEEKLEIRTIPDSAHKADLLRSQPFPGELGESRESSGNDFHDIRHIWITSTSLSHLGK